MTKTTNTKPSKKEIVKSFAWLVEAGARGFAGTLLVTSTNDNALVHYLTVATAIYLLITTVVIVSVHFVHAHKV